MQALFECEFAEGSTYDNQLKEQLQNSKSNSTSQVQKPNSIDCDQVRLNLQSCVEKTKK